LKYDCQLPLASRRRLLSETWGSNTLEFLSIIPRDAHKICEDLPPESQEVLRRLARLLALQTPDLTKTLEELPQKSREVEGLRSRGRLPVLNSHEILDNPKVLKKSDQIFSAHDRYKDIRISPGLHGTKRKRWMWT
jgi:hypothetical protein